MSWQEWAMFSLLIRVASCVAATCAARLLQSAYLRYRGAPAAAAPGGGCSQRSLCWLGVAVGVLLVLVFVQRHEDEPGVTDRLWTLLTLLLQTAAGSLLLAGAFELCGTSKPELADALREKQISYSEGAAWLFYLGYLEIIFGANGKPFEDRMNDYLSSQEIREEDRRNTITKKMFIVLPMNLKAVLPDKDFKVVDRNVDQESSKPLAPAATVGERKYGETHVYTVQAGGTSYRVAMEQATPLRSASLAVEDSQRSDFDREDFEAFAARCYQTLKQILENKPLVGKQVELVPIQDVGELGRSVAEHVRKLLGEEDSQGEEGHVPNEEDIARAQRQPEESSEGDSLLRVRPGAARPPPQ